MSLVPLGRNELPVGQPLAWDIYDGNGTLVARHGVVVADRAQADALLARGAYRDYLGPEHATTGAPAGEEGRAGGPATQSFSLDEVKLQIGDPVQIQTQDSQNPLRYYVRLVGYAKGRSVLLTMPMVEDRVALVREGQAFVVRAFSGKHAYAFTASVTRATSAPFPHMHLSWPAEVRGMLVRHNPRVETRIIAAVSRPGGGPDDGRAATLVNLSTSGALMACREPLGERGDALVVKFKLAQEGIESYLGINALIRATQREREEGILGGIRHGVEFVDLLPADHLTLSAYVYRKLADEG